MKKIDEFFYIVVTADKMIAEIHCKKTYTNKSIALDVSLIINFLKANKVIFGVDKTAIELLMTTPPSDQFPIIIAKGKAPIDGTDGKVVFEQDYNKTDIVREENWDFREVMQIPTVKKGDKLANIIAPTKGENGKNVHGKTTRGRSGKPVLLRAGKGTILNEDDQSFYADIEGQVSITDRMIQVHSVFEVGETLSLEVGNLDFVGSIIIRGDVPTGYTVKAAGDITISGIVEAATIVAGGSIYISEGLSGLKKGYVQAEDNVHIGYINQGIVKSGRSIYVENSIIHSTCSAQKQVLCKRGNIIGGSVSAGESVEAGDLGNRLSTPTMINLGLDKRKNDDQKKLLKEKQELSETLKKVKTLGEMLAGGSKQQDAKMKVTMLRQRRSLQQIIQKINVIDGQLEKMNAHLGSEEEANLIVRKTLHPNVIVSFGKYERKINITRKNVQLKLAQNDIIIQDS